MLSSGKIYPAWPHIGREPGASHSFLIGLVAAAVSGIASFVVISSLTDVVMTISRPISAHAIVFHRTPSAGATMEVRPAVTTTAPSPTPNPAAPASGVTVSNSEAKPEENMKSARKPPMEKHTWAWPHNSHWRSSSHAYGGVPRIHFE